MDEKNRVLVALDDETAKRLERYSTVRGIVTPGTAARMLIIEGLNRDDREDNLFKRKKGVA
jgi:hypothetical protein